MKFWVLPGESHGQKSLVSYSPWGHKVQSGTSVWCPGPASIHVHQPLCGHFGHFPPFSSLLDSPGPSCSPTAVPPPAFHPPGLPICCSSVLLLQKLRSIFQNCLPRTAARQASLSITNSWSLPKPMSIESVMPSNQLIPFSRPQPFPASGYFQ